MRFMYPLEQLLHASRLSARPCTIADILVNPLYGWIHLPHNMSAQSRPRSLSIGASDSDLRDGDAAVCVCWSNRIPYLLTVAPHAIVSCRPGGCSALYGLMASGVSGRME